MLQKLIVFVLTIAISLLWLSHPAYAIPSEHGDVKPTSTDIDTVLSTGIYTVPSSVQGFSVAGVKNAAQRSSYFVKRCLFGKPSNGLDEIGCGVIKTGIQAGLLVTLCYTADGVATVAFPPAGTLAPVCNYLGIAKASQKVLAH